jgi:hypothetical protein
MKRFENAKVGDRVCSFRFGWGTIIKKCDTKASYPLYVEFDDGDERRTTYLLDGYFNIHEKHPDLYWDELKFEIPERPKRKVKKTHYIWVDIYRDFVTLWTCEEDAMLQATSNCLETRKIPIEFWVEE